MKNRLLTFLAGIALALAVQQSARAHSDVVLGPNGGRILDFSKNQTLHGEVTVHGNQIHIIILDSKLKPVAIEKQTLTAITGDRNTPEKLKVETKDDKFIVPLQKGDDHWTIFQFRESPDAKPVTARLHFETKPCAGCKKPEWLCVCASEKAGRKK